MARNSSRVPTLEFIKGRIYLGAYDSPPNNTDNLVFFTVENDLPYNAFHLDFGPLHMGHLYRFAVVLHDILNDIGSQGKAIVFYSSTTPKARANAACLLCCYMVLIQSWSPHQVLQPISQIEPPLMPFRDAGYANADFEITIQDVVYGVWRAKERGMIDLDSFDLEEFEQFERVDQGDLNLISKDFVAFASPQQSKPGAPLNDPFKKVLGFFKKHDVKMVVRLNSRLYDSQEFTKRGINHIDMIFDDGTCPTMEFVRNFIGVAEGVIAEGGKIAVHCKAGLGRTGCLIGAHLIYTHGFSANECIGYMRMIRPGMVVGPQQHWLYLHQNEFRNWKFTMVLDNVPIKRLAGYCSLIPYDDFKAKQKSKYGNINTLSPLVNRRRVSGRMKKSLHTAVPITSPGQPRKGINGSRYVSTSFITNSDDEKEENVEEEENNDEEEIDEEEGKNDEENIKIKHDSLQATEISMDKENSNAEIKTKYSEDSSTSLTSLTKHHKLIDHSLEGDSRNFQIKPNNYSDTTSTPKRETNNLEKRRKNSPQSSWRVLRSITSPNSNKTTTHNTNDIIKQASPVSSRLNKTNTTKESSRSRSGARARHRIVSQGSINENVVSTGAIQKVSNQRRRS